MIESDDVTRPYRRGRGQVYTLEAFTAAVVLLASLAFALGMVGGPAGTDGSAPTTQEAEVTDALLTQAIADGSLRRTLLYWNETFGKFHGAGSTGHYVARAPPTAFGDMLASTFENRSVVFEMTLVYATTDAVHRQPLVDRGNPGNGAQRISRRITLYDRDVLYAPDESPTDATLGNSSFWMPDASPGPVYGVVEVEVVVWQV